MFKKREGIDILDLPELHRKKLIQLPETKKNEETKITSDGYFVLSEENQKQETIQTTQIESPKVDMVTPQVSNFLSDFASIGSSIPQITPEAKIEDKEEIKDLKWRLENLEFKLEQLIERIDSINR
ncbi:MAG: hypothetical protein ACP5N7_06610 [Candidatus Pacearchaeota archaeon]